MRSKVLSLVIFAIGLVLIPRGWAPTAEVPARAGVDSGNRARATNTLK